MTIQIEGMMCAHCRARVEKAIKAVAGVEAVDVSLEQHSATVQGTASVEAVKKAVTDAGYRVIE